MLDLLFETMLFLVGHRVTHSNPWIVVSTLVLLRSVAIAMVLER